MASDFGSTFHRLAPEPQRSLDVDALIAEGAPRRRARVVVIGVAVVLLIAGGAITTSVVLNDPAERVAAGLTQDVDVIAELSARSQGGGSVQPFSSVTGLLGNVLYKVADQRAKPLTEAVVVGEVLDVEAGRGFRVDGDDAPGGTSTDFNDPRALWRTVHVSVAVESVVSGNAGESVVVGFAFDPAVPLEEVARDFRSFGQMLLFLNRSPVFAYDASIYGTVSDGELLGLVDDSGNISLPVVSDDEEADLLTGASTVGHLRDAAEKPQRVIHLDTSGQVVDP